MSVLRIADADALPPHLRELNRERLQGAAPTRPPGPPTEPPPAPEPAGLRPAPAAPTGRGRPPQPASGRMNRTEARYAEHLEARRLAGEIAWYGFEAWRFRLAGRTFYTPDFLVMLADGEIEAHEVKGFWEDDARVKIKVAAELHPIAFVAVMRDGDGWRFERFGR